jgi:two-component system LytT family sensor kinase
MYRGLKHSLAVMGLVPIFFFLMNPNFHQEGYWNELWFSTRIGIQIGLFCWLVIGSLYAAIKAYNEQLYLKLKNTLRFQIFVGLLVMLIGLSLTSLAEPYISGRPFGLQSISFGMLVGGVTFLAVIVFVAYKQMQETNLKLAAQSAEANLNVLKNQMQPHFLFNSLNSLSELIEINKDHASNMTQKLADLYREILNNSKAPLSSVESEISIIQKYLELEKLRFGDRLKYNIEVPPNFEKIFLPSLVLQTLVENSVKHGVGPSLDGGEIQIRVANLDKGYKVEIRNTGEFSKSGKSAGTGLENTRSRLDLVYGDKHNLQLERQADTTLVSFWFSGEAAHV